MTSIGYARVSTRDQDPAAQQRELEAAGCTRVFVDHGESSRVRDLKRGLDERVTAMRERAQVLVDDALHHSAPWVLRLGAPPAATAAREQWMREARTVASYRELHAYTGTGDDLLEAAAGRTQLGDAKAAQAALRRAAALAAEHGSVTGDVRRLAPHTRTPTLEQ